MKCFGYIVALVLTFSFSQGVSAQQENGRNGSAAAESAWELVEPTWESINRRGYPQWFSDAKLGIFIHWGLYSVPAYASPEGYGEWYYKGLMAGDEGRRAAMRLLMEQQGIAHVDSLQAQHPFGYDHLRPLWRGELWQPQQWAQLFKEAGAQYVLLVTKHHDGYCLWDYDKTVLPEWNSVVSGPQRNIVAELTTAVRNEGMRMGFYFSLPEWSNPLHRWTEHPNEQIENYMTSYLIPQFKDLVTKYKPSVIFSDGDWDNTAEQLHSCEMISWYYNMVGPDAIVNDRWGIGNQHGFRTPEYSGGIVDISRPWAECRGVGRSFGVNRNERLENFISNQELIRHFAQLVAAGGGMTLNVGPNADGTIPFIQQERLLALGEWLKVNGEAIYGSRPWTVRQYEKEPFSLQRTDSVLNFNWVRNAPQKELDVDSFSAVWRFTVQAPTTDDYTFVLLADDKATLYSVADEAGKHGAVASQRVALCTSTKDTARYTLRLHAGQRYEFEIEYEETNLEAVAKLLWQTKTMPLCPVEAEGGFHATYRCQKSTICYTTKNDNLYAIVTEWPARAADGIAIAYPTAPAKDMQVSLLGSDKPIVWKYKNGKIHIALDNIEYHDLAKTPGAWTFKLTDLLK